MSTKPATRQPFMSRDFVRNTPLQRLEGEQALEYAKRAVEVALDKKAIEPVLLNVGELCSYTSFILVVSGRSDRQVSAIAQSIHAELKPHLQPLGAEGLENGDWALIDFGDLIVHAFHHPTREHYDLESLWVDAPRVDLKLPPEALASHEDLYPKGP